MRNWDVYCNYHWTGCGDNCEKILGICDISHTCDLKKNHEGEHKCWCGELEK
jgi:hypothetical protein